MVYPPIPIMRKILVLWLCCFCLVSVSAVAQPRQKVFTGMVESLKDAYNNHSYKTIHLLLTPGFAKELPLSKMTTLFDGIHSEMGNWSSVTQKSLDPTTGVAQYVAHFQKGDADFTLDMDKEDIIEGMMFKIIPGSMLKNAQPNAQAPADEPRDVPQDISMNGDTEASGEEQPSDLPHGEGTKMTEEEREQLMNGVEARQDVDSNVPKNSSTAQRQRPKTPQVLTPAPIKVVSAKSTLLWPFAPGQDYTIVWGGTTAEMNAHASVPEQRFALDIVQTNATGATHGGDGSKNTDYIIYGKKLRSSTAGNVVRVIKGVPENAPGQTNPYQVTGNTVIIQTPEGEFVLYAHLQSKSIKLKEGKKIKAGKAIGTVGNSGNTSEPHLHFQVMTKADLAQSECLLPIFQELVRVGAGAGSGAPASISPVKGEIIRAAK